MGNLGFPELLIIVLLILVFFGSKKIPELLRFSLESRADGASLGR